MWAVLFLDASGRRSSITYFRDSRRKRTSGQGFRRQPMGRNGQPRQSRSLLISTVQARENFYGSTSAACSLALRSSFDRQGVPARYSSVYSLSLIFLRV
jgi:hypothetical protein